MEATIFVATVFYGYITICYELDEAYRIRICARRIGMVMFIAGFLLFSLHWHSFEQSALRVIDTPCNNLSGTVCAVSNKDECYEYVVKTEYDGGKCKVLAREYDTESASASIGDNVIISGELRNPNSARNPGCFNYKNYLRSKKIQYVINAKSIEVLQHDKSFRFVCSNWINNRKEVFIGSFSAETGSFVKGSLFGDKGLIDDELYDEFAANGTAHILAVSGLHVGFILSLITAALRGKRSKQISILITVILIGYGFLTAWSPATIRAVIIAVIALFSIYVRRPFDLTSALSASIIVSLTISPYQIYNSGFIMSYLAMYGISFLTNPFKRIVGEEAGGLVAIQVAMIPYTCYAFNRINLLSIFINIPIILIASMMIPAYAIGFITFIAMGSVIAPLRGLIEVLTETEININRLLYAGGILSLDVCSHLYLLIISCIFLFYLSTELFLVLHIRREYKLAARLACLILIPAIAFCYGVRNEFLDDEVVFVDVGQGDAIHLRAGNRDILFDGGGNDSYNVGHNVLKPYLLKNGAKDIDMLFLTHLHMDHAKASGELAEEYRIKNRVIPYFYKGSDKYLESDFLTKAGDTFDIGKGVSVEVLWPLEASNSGYVDLTNENELNAVYMINYRGTKILITGDILEDDESDMVEYYSGTGRLDCDVLKVAHHGSNSSSSDCLLDAANPKIAVIQVGEHNLYGHPSDATLEKLYARGIKVYRTDKNGAIGIDIKRNSFSVDRMIEDVI